MRIQHKKILTEVCNKWSLRIRPCHFSKTIYYAINDIWKEVFQFEIIPVTSTCVKWLYIKEFRWNSLFKKDIVMDIVEEYREIIKDKDNMFFDTPYNYCLN